MEPSVILILIVIFLPFLFATLSRRKRKSMEKDLEKSKTKFKSDLQASQNDLVLFVKRHAELENKYSPITDIEKHVQQLLATAHQVIDEEKSNSKRNITQAKNQISQLAEKTKELNITAQQKVQDSKSRASEIERVARHESERIIEFAHKSAQEIAGDAYEAKQKADIYEKAIRAMRNTIEGYKDEYIVPNHSVLDDLADEYTHKEAGSSLKATRATIRSMVKDNHAGDCDYVEAHRKMYAIHFAVDAFNGKVDSVLAKVKHDNYGKLEQEIIDAFALVNHNGLPFRSARITQEYLDVRLTELKWAVATSELRKIEKAEQAEIKAQIREEEKVIREIEKARITAEKEERLIQKTLAKVRKELSQASDDQKLQYEIQLAELEGKLQEAEEKGQRALSMAQQTRRGHVYVISNIGSFGEEIFKVGMTRRLEPLDRVKELGDASVPFSFDVHAMIYSDDAPTLEKALHKKFKEVAVNKINPRKEFFRTSLSSIKQTVEEHGLNDIHWTMKAEAAQYRESLSIDKHQQEEKNVA